VTTRAPASTAKGLQQSEAILEATLKCLGRDGYAATSLQRIADEAGVQKRMIIYYFGSREALFEQAVKRVGDRLLAQVEEAVEGLEDPAEIVSAGFSRIWTAATDDRGLLVAYYGLVAESVTNEALRRTTGYVNEGYRRLIALLVERARERGLRLRWDEESLKVLIIAGVHGLTLELLERGDTPGLRLAIEDFQRWLASLVSAD
jgi:TetR/AcrR family transcriptional regulator, transcriptional repressor of bet genes